MVAAMHATPAQPDYFANHERARKFPWTLYHAPLERDLARFLAQVAAQMEPGDSFLLGTDLVKYNQRIKFIECPFTGQKLAAIPAHRPDVTIIHAQKADRRGNVLMWGVVGVQKEAVLAAERAIVTVEEIVDELSAPPNSLVLPSWVLSAVCEVKGGAFPSYAQGYYQRDNAFYKAWDAIARERDAFRTWIGRHVLGTKDFAEFKRSLEAATSHV